MNIRHYTTKKYGHVFEWFFRLVTDYSEATMAENKSKLLLLKKNGLEDPFCFKLRIPIASSELCDQLYE